MVTTRRRLVKSAKSSIGPQAYHNGGPLSLPLKRTNFDPYQSCDALPGHLNRSSSCPISITPLSSILAAMNAASAITRCGPMPKICGLSRALHRTITSRIRYRKTIFSPIIVICAINWRPSPQPSSGGWSPLSRTLPGA